MIELVATLLLGAAFAGVMYLHEIERRAWTRERADLLNRLMTKTWVEYQALAPQKTEGSDVIQLTTEEAEAAWYASEQKKMEQQYPGMKDRVARDFAEAIQR